MLFKKKTKKFRYQYIDHHEHGLALVIVLLVSAIAATTTMAVTLSAYNSYVNGTRQSLADRAKEAAESGLNILIESLNQDHPEWLIEPYDGDGSWSISRASTGGCRTSIGVDPTIAGTSIIYDNGTEGRYRLTSYSFEGNNFYGGAGSFEMEGEIRSSDNNLLASAKIYQDMSIIAKACDSLPGDNSEQESIWTGIYVSNRISRYNNVRALVKGTDPEEAATILCGEENCGARSRAWDSEFPPWPPEQGDIEMPNAQQPPEELTGIDIYDFEELVNDQLANCEPFRIPEDLPEEALIQDNDGTWHVYIEGGGRISLNGHRDCRRDDYSDAIKISGDNPVRLYIEGTIKIDRYTWIDTTDVNHAADFMILGSTNSTTNLDLVGISPDEEAMKAFIWLPNGRVKINAVRNQKRVLEGAIWAENFWAEGNALLGTTDIFVPEDMPQLIYQRLGQEFGIGQRDYVAQGVTSWYSYGRTND